jgi:hypothetical protein
MEASMRLLVLILVIVGGLWLIASVGSARADTDRAARAMGRPLPEIDRLFEAAAQVPDGTAAPVPVAAEPQILLPTVQ